MTQQPLQQSDLINYFLRVEGDEVRSVAALSANLEAFLDLKVNPKMTPKGLALVLFHATAKAKKGIYGEDKRAALHVIEGFVQEWTDRAIKFKSHSKVPSAFDYNGFTIGHMLTTFAMLNIVPPERFSHFAFERATALMPRFDHDDIGFTLPAIAQLGLVPDSAFLKAINTRISQIKNEFDGPTAYKVLWALAVIDSVQEHHHAGKKRTSLSPSFDAVINDPLVGHRLVAHETVAHRNMLSDAYLWFRNKSIFPRAEEDDLSSLFEVHVRDRLASVNAHVGSARIIDQPRHRIDLQVEFNKVSFLLECDGPHHFNKMADNGRQIMNGPTVFQTGLIMRGMRSETLVRLPDSTFYQNVDNEDFWKALPDKVKDKPQGAYLLAANGSLLPIGGGFDPTLTFDS